MKIKNLKQTCEACPSQWEAKTIGNRNVYIRYRWGYLTVWVADKPEQDALDGRMVHEQQLGDGLDGYIKWEEVEPTIKLLDLNKIKTNVRFFKVKPNHACPGCGSKHYSQLAANNCCAI